MSQIISFAWTVPALLARRKTRTRRLWDDGYAKRFKVGDIVQAWDKQPRFKGKKIAEIKIISIKKENISLMPSEDFEKEGFKYMEEQELRIWGMNPRDAFDSWRNDVDDYWVIDFEIIRK